jgi:flavin-dependent dehydrogenase
MDQPEEQHADPAPIEPGHVMSREKFDRMLEEQAQKQ